MTDVRRRGLANSGNRECHDLVFVFVCLCVFPQPFWLESTRTSAVSVGQTACFAMPPGRKPNSAHARKLVLMSWELTVKGGMLKAPAVVETIKELYKGRDVTFVAVTGSTPWLCEMVAGVCASKRPLARCSIITTLRKLLIQDDATMVLPPSDVKMAALFDGDDEPEKEATPKIKRPRGRAADEFVPTVVEVRVPVPSVEAAPEEATRAAPAEAGERPMLMLRCSHLTPRIEVDAISWLVDVLRAERETRGVPLMKPRAERKKGEIWWDFTNSLWRGRFYDVSGEMHERSQSVRLRRRHGDLMNLPFEDAKARVFDEMIQWRDELLGPSRLSGS